MQSPVGFSVLGSSTYHGAGLYYVTGESPRPKLPLPGRILPRFPFPCLPRREVPPPASVFVYPDGDGSAAIVDNVCTLVPRERCMLWGRCELNWKLRVK